MKRYFPLLAAVLVVAGCASRAPRPFPSHAPVWKDPDDFRTYAPSPEDFVPATIFDGVDELLLRPIPRFFAVDNPGRAKNVNSMDEVPDSAWFTNRIGRAPMSPEAITSGACTKPIDPKGPFEVLAGKPDGFNPGFLVKAPDGRKYFFKFDQNEMQPERMSSAETVGALIYHAVGFTVPCNQVFYFDRPSIVVGKGSKYKNAKGEKVPITNQFIDDAFKLVKPRPDGKVRSVASELLEGKPLGPFRYWGRRDDDPNDVIEHQDRREIRGGYVLASWIGHFDTRDQNTLDMWIADKKTGIGFVRHDILDFGDAMGNTTDMSDYLSKRLTYAYYFDAPYFVGDFLTLGVIERPWDQVRYGPTAGILGYWDVDHYEPDRFRPGYPNPAFQAMREADGAWMARLIAEFRDDDIRAMVAKARIEDPMFRSELAKILIGRRDKVLARYFSKISPLSHPEVRGNTICLRDLAAYAGTIGPNQRSYEAAIIDQEDGDEDDDFELTVKMSPFDSPQTSAMAKRPKPAVTPARKIASDYGTRANICVPLPEPLQSRKTVVLRVLGKSEVAPEEKALDVHLYREQGTWKIAGVERLE